MSAAYKKMDIGQTIKMKGSFMGKFRAIANYARKSNKYFDMEPVDGGIKIRRIK